MTRATPADAIRATPEHSFLHVDRLPGPPTAARKAASRAVNAGELIRVRRGLYYRGRRTRYGLTVPLPEDVAKAVLGERGVGPAGYSAARVWGVTTQVPPRWQVATLRTVDPIAGVEQHERRNLARMDLSAKEIALLELLRAPDVYVEAEWGVLVDKVRAAANTGEIDFDRLASAVSGEYHRAVRDNFTRLTLSCAQP